MDPRERRRQTAAAARLGFLGIAFFALLLLGLRALSGAGEDTQAAAPARAEARPPGAGTGRVPRELLEASRAREAEREAERHVDLEETAGAAPPVLDEVPAQPDFQPARVRHDEDLARRLEAHVAEAVREARERTGGKVHGGNTTVAIHVLQPDRGVELVSRLSDTALIPASNMKVVTSAAALVLLGPDWHFETRCEARGVLRDGVLEGDLCVRAGADPLYDPEAGGEVAGLLEPLTRALAARGLRRIRGDLVLDEGSYLEPGPGPGWPPASQSWQEHCALSGGFTANGGCLTANVRAGAVGARAWSEVRPAAHGLARVGEVRTVAAGARLDVAVGAVPGRVTLRGEFPANLEAWSDRFAAPDPVELFGNCLRAALEDAGIAVEGALVRRRGDPEGELLAVLRTPIADALYPTNLDSMNSIADQLFFALGDALGEGGTRAGGERATRRALRLLGVPTEGLVQVDGSGLSRDSRLTARQLTALLSATRALEPRAAELFYDTLPVAGESGSLARRMRESPARGRVHAKTGWIEGASALSGFVETAAGERLVFSILVGYPRAGGLNTHCWKPMQDAICEELVGWHE